jgi:hypothetical protein
VNDAIFVLSTLQDNTDVGAMSEQFFPFSMLYNPMYVKSSDIPRKPILLSRGSNSATFKLPPFAPRLQDSDAINLEKKTISSMAIYGKISANGVNVSTTCNDLSNTGTR